MADVGDLAMHRGKWITLAPEYCPQGHRLGPKQVLVGHAACQGHGGGGHTLWHCVACPKDEPPVYGPRLASHCTLLEGPALHRLSNR